MIGNLAITDGLALPSASLNRLFNFVDVSTLKKPVQNGQNEPFSRETLIPRGAVNLTAENTKTTGAFRYESDSECPVDIWTITYAVHKLMNLRPFERELDAALKQ